MRRRTCTTLPWLAALLLLGAGVLPCVAAEPLVAREAPAPSSLLELLGTPARADAVRQAVQGALAEAVPPPRLLAETLGYAGGAAALDGLTRLLHDRDEDVRIAALDAMVQVGLRSETSRAAVREIATDGRGRARERAARTLGAVGDGRDLALLLALASAEEAPLRRAAYHALGQLTGARIPYQLPRWEWYVRVLERRAQALVGAGLARLDEAPEEADVGAALQDLVHYAWLDLPLVREYLARWTTDMRESRRQLACRVAAELRLADCADDVRGIRLFAVTEALRQEADRALALLGV